MSDMSEKENPSRPKSAQELIAEALRAKGMETKAVKARSDEEVVERILTTNEEEEELSALLQEINNLDKDIDELEKFQEEQPDFFLDDSEIARQLVNKREQVSHLRRVLESSVSDQNELEGVNSAVVREVVSSEKIIAQELEKVAKIGGDIDAIIKSLRNYDDIKINNRADGGRDVQFSVKNQRYQTEIFSYIASSFSKIHDGLLLFDQGTILKPKAKEILAKKMIGELEKLVETSIAEIRKNIPDFDDVSAEQQKFANDITQKKQAIGFAKEGHSYEILRGINYLDPNDVEIQDNTRENSFEERREHGAKLTWDIKAEVKDVRAFVEELEKIKEIKGVIFGVGEKGKKKDDLKKIRGKYDHLYRDIQVRVSRDLESDEELRQFSDKLKKEQLDELHKSMGWIGGESFKPAWDLDAVADPDQFIDDLITEQEQRIAKGEKIIDYVNTFYRRIDKTQGDSIKRKLVAVRFAQELQNNLDKFKADDSEKTT